jgi:GAF domain-containing protein
VVDCFDALTSDRPYRPAMTASDADAILRERRGTMYDPDVVDAFLRVRHQIELAPPSAQLQKAFGRILRAREEGTPTPPPLTDMLPEATNQLLALVSLARVASHAPTIADVGTLAWTHIRELVPHATLGLFVVDLNQDIVEARFAAGDGADRVTGLHIRLGQGMSGWVAANGQSVLNSDARLDLQGRVNDDLRFGVAIPLIAQGTVLGVMTLYARDAFGEDQRRMMEMVAPHLAVSIGAALATQAGGAPPRSMPAGAARPSRYGLRIVADRS